MPEFEGVDALLEPELPGDAAEEPLVPAFPEEALPAPELAGVDALLPSWGLGALADEPLDEGGLALLAEEPPGEGWFALLAAGPLAAELLRADDPELALDAANAAAAKRAVAARPMRMSAVFMVLRVK